MIKTLFVLHAYQPPYPIQEREVVRRIVKRTYLPFAETLVQQEDVKVVLNMSACLSDILNKEYPKVTGLLKECYEKGVLEFLDTGYYHPILPFLREAEFETQITEHSKFNCELFELSRKPLGFWPPELAVTTDTIKRLAYLDYKAIMVPENSLGNRKLGTLHSLNGSLLLSRNKEISNKIAFRNYGDCPDNVVRHMAHVISYDKTPVILAMDIETFGEHHQDYLGFLFNILNHRSVKCIGIKELLKGKNQIEEIDGIRSSSWSTDDSDAYNGIPFPLWKHPQNPLHQIQHAHMSLLESAVQIFGGVNRLDEDARTHYLMAEHSCQFWWAHGCSYMWCPSMIKRGFESQITALERVTASFDPNLGGVLREQSNMLWEQLLETLNTH